MTSKTTQRKLIEKRKRHPNKANRKADRKRFLQNRKVLDSSEKTPATE